MSRARYFNYPTFRETKIPKIRLAHWKPITAYTQYRWVVQAIIVILFVLVPQLHWLKLDFANDVYWLFGYQVSMRIALQTVVILWLGTYFINFFENYLIGRLLCGWICPWGLLNRFGMMINHRLRRHKHRQLILTSANALFAMSATLVVMNWGIDLGTLFNTQHAYFGLAWAVFGGLVLLGFIILHKMGFKFCEDICPFGMYLTVVTQKNSLRVVFDSSRACVDCGLCTQVCPMDLSPREMDFKDPMNGGYGQCILCGDCIDVCQVRMDLEKLPAPLLWNTSDNIIPLLPLEVQTTDTSTHIKPNIKNVEAVTVKKNPLPPLEQPKTQLFIGGVIIPIIVVGLSLVFAYTIRAKSSNQLLLPNNLVLVHAVPSNTAPVLARFGKGHTLNVTGRTEDWRWLEVELWDSHKGWTVRPLDVLVWQIEANVVTPGPPLVSSQPTPIAEKMISLPATTFMMGSPASLGENDEHPAHAVSLSAFEMDQTEVTVGQYWQCVAADVCAPPTNYASQTEPYYLNDPAFDNHPMINVPWLEANHYCVWRGKRLPTEAQWEMAASWSFEKKAKLLWPWGNDITQAQVNAGDTSLGEANIVGGFPADVGPTGVLDLAGNVSEWVFDWYKVDYYSVSDDTDPTGPSARRGEGSGRVVRGASFADSLDVARSSKRGHQAEQYGYSTVGFRCVSE